MKKLFLDRYFWQLLILGIFLNAISIYSIITDPKLKELEKIARAKDREFLTKDSKRP